MRKPQNPKSYKSVCIGNHNPQNPKTPKQPQSGMNAKKMRPSFRKVCWIELTKLSIKCVYWKPKGSMRPLCDKIPNKRQ